MSAFQAEVDRRATGYKTQRGNLKVINSYGSRGCTLQPF